MNEKPKMVSNFNISQVRNSKIERSNTVDDTKKRNHKLEKVERLNVTPASGLKKIKRIQCTDIQKKRLFMKGKEKSMIDNIAESNISISKKYVNDISCFTKPLKKIFELKNPNLALKKKYKKVKGKKAVVKKRVSSKSKNKNLDKSDLKMNIISNISRNNESLNNG